VGVAWRWSSTTRVGWAWWGLSLAFLALNVAASIVGPDGPAEVERARLVTFYVIMTVAYAAAAGASAAGASYVRAVSRRLSPTAPAASTAST
jgi:hypothetical protein